MLLAGGPPNGLAPLCEGGPPNGLAPPGDGAPNGLGPLALGGGPPIEPIDGGENSVASASMVDGMLAGVGFPGLATGALGGMISVASDAIVAGNGAGFGIPGIGASLGIAIVAANAFFAGAGGGTLFALGAPACATVALNGSGPLPIAGGPPAGFGAPGAFIAFIPPTMVFANAPGRGAGVPAAGGPPGDADEGEAPGVGGGAGRGGAAGGAAPVFGGSATGLCTMSIVPLKRAPPGFTGLAAGCSA